MQKEYKFIVKSNNCEIASYFLQSITNLVIKKTECDLMFNCTKSNYDFSNYYNALQMAIYNKVLGTYDELPGPEEYACFLERLSKDHPKASFIFDFDAIENYKLPDMNILFKVLMQHVQKLHSHGFKVEVYIKSLFLNMPGVMSFTDSTKMLSIPGLVVAI